MSHFLTYVLVSGSTRSIRDRVFHLMAPYNNDFEVQEYESECECNRESEAPDPDCEECGGTGVHLTTWNPMSQFDSYYIWDSQHVLRNASLDSSDWEDEQVFDDDIPDDAEEKAIAPLSSLDIERLKLPEVIVTPAGDWHEMEGDWHSEDKESADWQQWRNTVKEIFDKYPTAILVVLNCHR